LKFFNAKEQTCWTQTRKTHLYRIAPLRLQLKIATKRRFAKLFVSTIILTQIKKFQNRFWTISLYIRPLGERKRLELKKQISDRTLFFDFKNAWKILAFRKAAAQSAEASNSKNSENKIWLRLLNEIRTFFKENPDSD